MAIGRTNTGGGGVGGVLTVTAPAGVTVSVSKDGKVKTKTSNAEGLAVFKGLATGTWTLTITNGVQTSTKPVVITADYNTVIAFFSATINITYPVGSVCTCSNGSTTLTAPDTSGTWKCVVSNKGTWTVSCTNGTESKSETVSITTDGQNTSVELAYWDGQLYDAGDFTSITGGWINNVGSIEINSSELLLDGSGCGDAIVRAATRNKIKFDGYSKLSIIATNLDKEHNRNDGRHHLYVATTDKHTPTGYVQLKDTNKPYTLNVEEGASVYVGIETKNCPFGVSKIWMHN